MTIEVSRVQKFKDRIKNCDHGAIVPDQVALRQLKDEIRDLRKQGFSLLEITEYLNRELGSEFTEKEVRAVYIVHHKKKPKPKPKAMPGSMPPVMPEYEGDAEEDRA